MTYRLALALGSGSLGWCIFNTKDHTPVHIIDMGVRIFPDGRDHKTKEPLAVARRFARGRRRNYDRRALRQQRLMAYLIEAGLMPSDHAERKQLESLDPYELRSNALDGKIPLHHLGRALFHINQRRGFKDNRRTDRQDDNRSATRDAIRNLDAVLLATGSRTLGEYLYRQREVDRPVRVRPRMVNHKAEYDVFPSREICAREVDAILQAQTIYHPQLTDAVCDRITDVIFYQRALRPPLVGNCRFETGELRARLALPLVQKFDILRDVNNLRIEEPAGAGRPLDQRDRKKIIDALLSARKKTFAQLKALLNLDPACRFNLEAHGRKYLTGAQTDCALSDDSCFGVRWHEMSDDQQEQIIDILFDEPDPVELIQKLVTRWGLAADHAENVAAAALPDGHASLSKKAILKMMPYLENGMKSREAATSAGYHNSAIRSGEVFDHLPYYGEVLPHNVSGGSYDPKDQDLPEKYFGKVGNPSFHIALNQLRKLATAVIEAYGKPDTIVLQVARNLRHPADKVVTGQDDNGNPYARLTSRYLSSLFEHNNAGRRVWAVPEQVTALLRKSWELNDLLPAKQDEKDPADHRHHAIDAVTIGCIDKSVLKQISAAANTLQRQENQQPERSDLIPLIPEPFAGLRTRLEERLRRMVVSFKPDHGGAWKAIHAQQPYTVASLHRDTAYGLIKTPQDETPAFAHRVPVESLLTRAAIETVADTAIREALLAAVEGLPEGGTDWKQAIKKAAAAGTGAIMKNGIRRVRVHIAKRDGTMIGLYQPSEKQGTNARPYKYYEMMGNYCVEIFSTLKGRKAGQWQCEIISNYHAHQKHFIPHWRREDPTARLIMRLQINDVIVYESEGEEIICRVKKLSKLKNNSGTIFLRPHTIATEEMNKLSWEASARQLQLKNARKISVDIMGRVNKPRAHREKNAA